MDGVADTQEERRDQGRIRRPQVEGEQASGAMDLSQMQRAIEEMSQHYMRAHEQQQEHYLRQQEQYLKAQEQQEHWQQQMMEKQESFQLKMLEQQREFQARILEGQREQSTNFQESFNRLFLRQAKYGEYTQNLYQRKNIYHTIGEHRNLDKMEYDIETQAKLDYVVHSMLVLNQQIKPFEQCQELVDHQKAKVNKNIAHMQ
nr:GATA zinc finger domain-containing protein 10-like [Arachis hypogaea]